MSRPEAGGAASTRSGYLWTEIGAVLGAVAAGIPAAIGWVAAVFPVLFSSDGWYLVFVTGVALAIVIVGSALGCRFALRRRRLPAADRTAMLLAILLTILYALGFWSSGTELQSDLLPYLAASAPVMPLVARWLAVSLPDERGAASH